MEVKYHEKVTKSNLPIYKNNDRYVTQISEK